MTDDRQRNKETIEKFRANDGAVPSRLAISSPLVLVHSIGAKSGLERINPMRCLVVGDSLAVFASNHGAPSHPDWYHNLVAHPDVTVEFGTEVRSMRARVLAGAEREAIWEKNKVVNPVFEEYEQNTERQIPVVLFEPRRVDSVPGV